MADAMNFRAASTAPVRPVRGVRGVGNPNIGTKTPTRGLSIPKAPTGNRKTNQYEALKGLYDKNKKNYNSTQVGKKWKESYIKTGGEYVNTDFGDGNKGAGIPYSVGQRDSVRNSKRIAETESEGAYRKAKEAAEKAKTEAIKRRQKKKK